MSKKHLKERSKEVGLIFVGGETEKSGNSSHKSLDFSCGFVLMGLELLSS